MMQELNRNITSMAEAHVSAMIEPITTEINRKNNKDFDWNDIVKDKIVPYLKNPLSGKIGTEEEKQAFYKFIQKPTYSYLKRMKVDSPLWFERFLNFLCFQMAPVPRDTKAGHAGNAGGRMVLGQPGPEMLPGV